MTNCDIRIWHTLTEVELFVFLFVIKLFLNFCCSIDVLYCFANFFYFAICSIYTLRIYTLRYVTQFQGPFSGKIAHIRIVVFFTYSLMVVKYSFVTVVLQVWRTSYYVFSLINISCVTCFCLYEISELCITEMRSSLRALSALRASVFMRKMCYLGGFTSTSGDKYHRRNSKT